MILKVLKGEWFPLREVNASQSFQEWIWGPLGIPLEPFFFFFYGVPSVIGSMVDW